MKIMELPTIIFGSKGASKEVYYCIKQINESNKGKIYKVLGFIEAEENLIGQIITDGVKVVTSDDNLEDYISSFDEVNFVLPFGNGELKSKIYNKSKHLSNVIFPNIIHSNVILNKEAIKMGIGNIIMPGAVLACDLEIGNLNLLNRCCTVGHDVVIGNNNTINPMAVISGNVKMGDNCLIGANATVLQGLNINSNTMVGAGAVVTKDTLKNSTVVGIPAKPIKKED